METMVTNHVDPTDVPGRGLRRFTSPGYRCVPPLAKLQAQLFITLAAAG
jgi:hypothetical protein